MASTLHDPALPAATRRTPARLGRRRHLLVMALVVVVLTLVPAAVSSLRPATVHSEVRLVPERGQQTRTGAVASLVEQRVNQPGVRNRIVTARRRSAWIVDLALTDVRATPAAPSGQGALISVPGATPGEARDVARLVAREVIARAGGAAARRAEARRAVAAVERALHQRGLTPARRTELESQRRFITVQALQDAGLTPVRVAAGPTRPEGDLVDRVVRPVISDGVPRPNPLWAGFVGLLLGVALCALWLALPVRGRCR